MIRVPGDSHYHHRPALFEPVSGGGFYWVDSFSLPAVKCDNKFLSEAEYLARYPGDQWVDIVGMDNWGDMGRTGDGKFTQSNETAESTAGLCTGLEK